MAKIQPAPKKLYFNIPATVASGYIDLSLAASVMNRRFYRQGLNWAVANLKCMTLSTEASTVGVCTLQDSWVTSNAWEKSFKIWNKMNAFALQEAPSVKPKFYDFKVFMDEAHMARVKSSTDIGGPGYQSNSNDPLGNLMPANYFNPVDATAVYLGGDWDYSEIVIPKVDDTADTDSYFLYMNGPDSADGKGIIEGYADSRAYPFSPDPETPDAAESWMTEIFRQGTDQTEDIIDDLRDTNDDLPYNQVNYPGGATNAIGTELVMYDGFSATNNSGVIQQINTGPFNAQCGLIKVQRIGDLTYPLVVEVTLMPGDHRGYLCQPMQDV